MGLLRTTVTAAAAACLLAGCASGGSTAAEAPSTASSASSGAASGGGATGAPAEGEELFPDVLEAEARRSGGGVDVDATISSPYDSPERYADAFRVRGEDGEVYGVRELTHDHASEQPFTRTLDGAQIPDGVERVVVEGRDQVSGWGGATVTVDVPAP